MATEACVDEVNITVVSDQKTLYLFPSDDKVFLFTVESTARKLYECSNMLANCLVKFSFTVPAEYNFVSSSTVQSLNKFRTQHGKIANPLHAMCRRVGTSSTNYNLNCGVFDSKFNYPDTNTWRNDFKFIDTIDTDDSYIAIDWVLDSKFLVQYKKSTSNHTL